MAFSGRYLHQMEVYWLPPVDPRETSVPVSVFSGSRLLTYSDFDSGFWEKRYLVCCPLLACLPPELIFRQFLRHSTYL